MNLLHEQYHDTKVSKLKQKISIMITTKKPEWKKIFLRLSPKINFFALFTKFTHKIHVVWENINKIKYYKNIYNKLYNQSKQEREK